MYINLFSRISAIIFLCVFAMPTGLNAARTLAEEKKRLSDKLNGIHQPSNVGISKEHARKRVLCANKRYQCGLTVEQKRKFEEITAYFSEQKKLTKDQKILKATVKAILKCDKYSPNELRNKNYVEELRRSAEEILDKALGY
ncbi:MAG TPA: hypothetical protein VEL47_04710 [Myxococcota bacterium]|nr:hypothetical protein [Myxococcota bacterium]